MNSSENWSLIAGICQSITTEEEHRLMDWVRLDPANQNRLEEARRVGT